MSLSRIAFLSASLLVLAPLTWAQRSAAVEPQTATTYTGKFVYEFTLSIESTISTSVPIYCYGKASTSDGLNTLTESGSVTATRSGSTATCTVTLPYSWALTDPSSDKVTLSFQIIADTNLVTPPVREVDHQLGEIAIPANGATSTEKITVVM